MLVPMGIINRWHEPPVFYGVDRPSFDQSIIPTTWRELGAGFAGRVAERWRWEAYVMTAIDPTRLGPDGIIGGRGSGMLQPARAAALVGRVEYAPWLGTIIGLAGYGQTWRPTHSSSTPPGSASTRACRCWGGPPTRGRAARGSRCGWSRRSSSCPARGR